MFILLNLPLIVIKDLKLVNTVIGAGDPSYVEKCSFCDDCTWEVWIRWSTFSAWTAARFQLKTRQGFIQKFPLSYLKIKGQGRTVTILAIIVVPKCELEYFPAISTNTDVTVISDCGPPNVISWALRAIRKEDTGTIGQSSGCSHSVWWALTNSKCGKHRMLSPDSWDAHERNDFSKPRLLHLPIRGKC